MGRPVGALSKRTSRGAELFGPHVDDAIAVIKEVMTRKYEMLYRKRIADDGQESYECEPVPGVKDTDALAAAKIILEYGLGKPIQPTEVSGPGGVPQQHEVRISFKQVPR